MKSIGKQISLNKDKVNFFRYKELGKGYLITNEIGQYVRLSSKDFKNFVEGKTKKETKLYAELADKHFLKSAQNNSLLIDTYRHRNAFLFDGPSLHIVVVTLRCNYNCIYCQASSKSLKASGYDMSAKTAKAVVDTIFQSPNPSITIEFQGGEPLANWPIIQTIVEYAEKKNLKGKKDLVFSLVTNLSLMDEEKYAYIVKHHISVCTSLDGPEKLHNSNRPFVNNNSYQSTTIWIKKFKEKEKRDSSLYKLSALVTISRDSLKYPKEIVEEYRKWNFVGIHLRPLSLLGLSGNPKSPMNYSVDEFLDFWTKSMDYIISLNFKGVFFYERESVIMLRKIFTDLDPNFLDLRSPCGAGIGQMLYNYNGLVYTCDEARMLGEDTFALGDVSKNNYKQIISHPNLSAVCQASILENSVCDYCAYKPYCGVCPVLNYSLYNSLFPPNADNYRCRLNTGMIDYLFKKMENPKNIKVFKNWLGIKKSKQ